MSIIDKYKAVLNSPDVVAYVGESKRRKFLVKFISALAVTILLAVVIILGLVLGKVLFSYFS